MFLVFTLLLSFFLSFFQTAQSDTSQLFVEKPSVKLGISLSGGGAKGLAHVGVLKVLEAHGVRPDVITGTSFGSIVGGLYAIGYSATEIEEIVLAQNWDDLLSDNIPRMRRSYDEKFSAGRYAFNLPIKDGKIRLPESLVTGQLASELLSRLTLGYHDSLDFRQFPIPYAAVGVVLESGEAFRFEGGVLAETIRASMSIPSMLQPMKIGNIYYLDGGISRNLPVSDALALGADVVIAVDVSDPLKNREEITSLLDVMDQTVSYQIVRSTVEQRGLANVVIRPDLSEYGMNSYYAVKELIALGESAAKNALDEIQQLADSLNLAFSKETLPSRKKNIVEFTVSQIEVQGLESIPYETIIDDVNLRLPAVLVVEDVQSIVQTLYGTGQFTYIRWQLVSLPNQQYSLVFKVKENTADAFRFGFRFDSYHRASILLNAGFFTVGKRANSAQFEARIGDDIMLDGTILSRTSRNPRLQIKLNANYSNVEMDVFDREPVKINNIVLDAGHFDLSAGLLHANKLVVSFGLRSQVYQYGSGISSGVREFIGDRSEWINELGFRFWFDETNSALFPTSGARLDGKLAISDAQIVSQRNFVFAYSDMFFAIPFTSKLSLTSRSFVGVSAGRDQLPFHYLFYMGGANTPALFGYRHFSMASLPPMQFHGSNIMAADVGFQWEPVENRFIGLKYQAGTLFEQWESGYFDRLNHGAAFSFGVKSPFGPVEVQMGSGNFRTFRLEINIGYRF